MFIALLVGMVALTAIAAGHRAWVFVGKPAIFPG